MKSQDCVVIKELKAAMNFSGLNLQPSEVVKFTYENSWQA